MGKLETIKDIVGIGANAADKLHTSADEAESHIDKRWESDNQTDNWLAKAVRPIVILSLLGAWIAFNILAIWFPPILASLPLTKEMLQIVLLAYFGGRSWEKIKKVSGRIAKSERRDERRSKRQDEK